MTTLQPPDQEQVQPQAQAQVQPQVQPQAQAQPQVQPQFPHRMTKCDRHPDLPVTGFCASCLRERLAGLDTAVQRRSSNGGGGGGGGGKGTVTTKSVFFRQRTNGNGNGHGPSASSASFLPELRRCKSFSLSSSNGGLPSESGLEPQRRSCDVRGRNTLWSLFHLNDQHRHVLPVDPSSSSMSTCNTFAGEINVGDPKTLVRIPNFSITGPVKEKEEEEEEEDEEFHEAVETRLSSPSRVSPGRIEEKEENEGKTAEEGEVEEIKEVKPTRGEHLDLDSQPSKKPPSKDLKEIAGSFWLAASVFSKKLQKWRRKQKLKKQQANGEITRSKNSTSSRIRTREKLLRSTQSEIAVDMFGRRSCDTDPRFSLDVGRMSLDDPRFSWDEPRASWDGYLIGGGARSMFPRLPPILSVVEDTPAPPIVQRSDGLIPVEEDSTTPGGSAQTRDYYLDTTQRRRRSLERSSSVRRAVGVVLETDISDLNPKPVVSNAKVSPTMSADFFQHSSSSIFERDIRDLNSSLNSSQREKLKPGLDVPPPLPRPPPPSSHLPKKPRKWIKAWNIFGLINRNRANSGTESNGVGRSLSESWPELKRIGSIGRMSRSNSSVSSRHSFSSTIGGGGTRRNGSSLGNIDVMNGHHNHSHPRHNLDRNSSGRHLDNSLLKFYITPMRSSNMNINNSRRTTPVTANSRQKSSSHSFTRNLLRLY